MKKKEKKESLYLTIIDHLYKDIGISNEETKSFVVSRIYNLCNFNFEITKLVNGYLISQNNVLFFSYSASFYSKPTLVSPF